MRIRQRARSSNLGETIHEAGAEAAEAAEGGLTEISERLETLQQNVEASTLAEISEKITEFGQEALGAADNVTRAGIALTTITGNGNQAQEIYRRAGKTRHLGWTGLPIAVERRDPNAAATRAWRGCSRAAWQYRRWLCGDGD